MIYNLKTKLNIFSKRYSLKNSLIQAKSNFKIFDAALKSVKYKKAISL